MVSSVVYSAWARIRVTFPESAKSPAEDALRRCFENRALPKHVADKFFAAHYQVVRVDVFEDGTVRMSAAADRGEVNGAIEGA